MGTKSEPKLLPKSTLFQHLNFVLPRTKATGGNKQTRLANFPGHMGEQRTKAVLTQIMREEIGVQQNCPLVRHTHWTGQESGVTAVVHVQVRLNVI